jgi:hypothetical protein
LLIFPEKNGKLQMIYFGTQLAREILGMGIEGQEVLPLLRIRVLGALELSFGDDIVAMAAQFSIKERRLLGLPITNSSQQISAKNIMYELYGERPRDNDRRAFDTMLFRLRKKVNKMVGPQKGDDYLDLNKGILWLKNCSIDAQEFEHFAKQGLAHGHNREWWMADNAFVHALALYRGNFVSAILMDLNSVYEYPAPEPAGRHGHDMGQIPDGQGTIQPGPIGHGKGDPVSTDQRSAGHPAVCLLQDVRQRHHGRGRVA